MVDDRVTDGKRIAQLLSSELSGRSTGELARVTVVDADPEAVPSPDGTLAYRVAVDETPVARVALRPDAAVLYIAGADDTAFDVDAVADRAAETGLTVREDEEAFVVRVDSGAAVKRAFDALRAGVI